MIKRLLVILAIFLFALMVYPLVTQIAPFKKLTPLATQYVENETKQLGAANLVTAVVVTYRGLDTLGEVKALSVATAGFGLLLRKRGLIHGAAQVATQYDSATAQPTRSAP